MIAATSLLAQLPAHVGDLLRTALVAEFATISAAATPCMYLDLTVPTS